MGPREALFVKLLWLLVLSVEDFLTACLNVVGIIRAITLNSCKTVFRHSHTAQKWRNSFYDRTLQSPDFVAADEWASYSPDLNPLDYWVWDILQDWVYKGRRLPFICKSTGPERGNPKQMEGGHHWVSSEIHCTIEKNDWLRLQSRMEARFSKFSANRCDWISISCSETC